MSVGGLEHLQGWLARVGERPAIQRGMDIPEAFGRPQDEEKSVAYGRQLLS